MPFELQIALRYLLAKRKQALISLISFISVIGVGVGVMAVVLALAMMTGLQQEVRNRILGANAHVYVWNTAGATDYRAAIARLDGIPHVVGAAPSIQVLGLLQASGTSEPVQIKGIDPALERGVTDLAASLDRGSLAGLERRDADDLDGILLGSSLAASAGVGVGDVVSVLTAAGVGVPGGRAYVPRRLRVAGIFTMGLVEFDTTFGFVSLETAMRLKGVDTYDLIQIRADGLDRAQEIKRAILALPGSPYKPGDVQDWTDMNQPLFRALSLEKLAMSLAIGLIVMVAALNIVGTLILLVMEKHRDIAILKTMGTSARSITFIFMLQGLIIGVVGTGAGAALGLLASTVLDRYKLIRIPEDVYQVSYLPFRVMPLDFTLVVMAAVFICFVATIYPSRQAARLDPAQALRYE